MEHLLESLNPRQREAVEHTDGPLLIVAGAGSGKTRVIVHRLAYILGRELAAPHEVVAVTFTNKAAGEMKGRVERLVGADRGGAQVSTFHSYCLRLLRRHADRLGFGRDFLIYDEADQTALLKDCLRDQQIDDKAFPVRLFRNRISSAKSLGLDAAAFERARESVQDDLVAKVYALYQERLKACNAMDFDDLIGHVLLLLGKDADLARHVAEGVRYLMVDEYQDTNKPQYRLIRHLAAVHGNVCAVGDPDQSIYRFRFAEIGNILSFAEDFPGTKTIKLEQNYRSTGLILEAATGVIRHNRDRIDKALWSEAAQGEPIEVLVAMDERHEAERVIAAAQGLRRDFGLDEMAVLYRTNAQSRTFEEALARAGVPYIIVGGTRFYDRREIKDLVAYLRAVINPRDDVSLRRVINTPARDIGRMTIDAIDDVARKDGGSFEAAIRKTLDLGVVSGRASKALRVFLDLLHDLRAEARDQPPSRLVRLIIERTRFDEYLEKSSPGDARSRIENLEEMASAVSIYDGLEDGLQAFLDRTALLSETENVQGSTGLRLMTLHSAKGLEFPVVFIVGLEENIFPHARSAGQHEDIEEERRLLYVGMTRAMRRLFLSRAIRRRQYGEPVPTEASRFLEEIPEHLVRLRDLEDPFAARINAAASAFDRRRLERENRREAAGGSGGVTTDLPYDVEPQTDGPTEGPYTLGMRLRHPEFGAGTVIGVEGAGDRLKVTVSFSIYGSKKFMARFAPLERL